MLAQFSNKVFSLKRKGVSLDIYLGYKLTTIICDQLTPQLSHEFCLLKHV